MFFRDGYWFLSNFYRGDVTLDGLTYRTAEAAFQAQKCENPADRVRFAGDLSGNRAKKLGRSIDLRPDWEEIKVDVMRRVIDAKFANPVLARQLVAVEGEIVEDNTWHDTFWGRCNGHGENWLGRILMEKRDERRRQGQSPSTDETDLA